MGKLYQSDLEMSLGNNVIVTQMTQAVNWARKYSFFIYPFITACCGMEFMSVAGPRYGQPVCRPAGWTASKFYLERTSEKGGERGSDLHVPGAARTAAGG